jgi:hypothetical protein
MGSTEMFPFIPSWPTTQSVQSPPGLPEMLEQETDIEVPGSQYMASLPRLALITVRRMMTDPLLT